MQIRDTIFHHSRNQSLFFIISIILILCTGCAAENQTAIDWYNKGTDLAKHTQYEEALGAYDKAIEINQSYGDPWNAKGNALQTLKRYQEAVDAYDKALTIDNKSISAWNGKGNSLKSLNHYDEALSAFQKTIEINTNYTTGYLGIASTLQSLQKYDEAIANYSKAIELDPKSLGIYTSKASVLQTARRYDDAIAVYDQALTINSSYIPAYTGKAGVYSSQKRYSEALNVYEKAIEKDPKSIPAWNGRGSVLQSLKRDEDAVKSFEHVIALNDTNAAAWRSKASSLRNLKRTSEAMAALDQALANDIKYFGAWMDKGNLLISLNDSPGAVEAFDQAIIINQSEPSAWNAKGKALMSSGKYAEAVSAFNKALELNPTLTDAQKNRDTAQFKIFQASNGTTVSNPVPDATVPENKSFLPVEQDSDSATSVKGDWLSGILSFLFGGISGTSSGKDYGTTDLPGQIRLGTPVDVSISNNTFLIADAENRSVIKSDISGKIMLIIGGVSHPGLFRVVTSVTADTRGNIYVLDAGAGKILKFDDTGRLLLSWGAQGSGPGQFQDPRQIESGKLLNPEREIVSVADSGNSRVQVFDTEGGYISSFSTLSGSDGSFFGSPDQPLLDNSSAAVQYINIIPEEKVNPPVVERTFTVHIKDTTFPMSMTVDRGMFLGAQKSKSLDMNVNEKNPEQWEQILKGALRDPVTVSTIHNTSAALQECAQANKLTDSESLDLLCSVIQQISLVNESDNRYPIEVINDKKGGSFDKSLFLYGLLYQAGYDVVFLSYPGTSHCAVGIRLGSSINKPAMKEYTLGNQSYVYINPDQPDIIGRINPDLNGVDPILLHLLPQDEEHSRMLQDIEDRLFILETLDAVSKKQAFIEANIGKLTSAAKAQANADLSKFKSVKAYVESNTWNTEAIIMRLKNSKVGDIQLNYGMYNTKKMG